MSFNIFRPLKNVEVFNKNYFGQSTSVVSLLYFIHVQNVFKYCESIDSLLIFFQKMRIEYRKLKEFHHVLLNRN